MLTLFKLTFILTIACTSTLIILTYLTGRRIVDKAFRLERKAYLTFLIVSLLSGITSITYGKYLSGQIEILSAYSIIWYYILFETFFFSTTAFYHAYYVRNNRYFHRLNYPIILAIIPYIINAIHYHFSHYYSISDIVTDCINNSNIFCIRFYMIFVLISGIIYMLILLLKSYHKYKKIVQHLTPNTSNIRIDRLNKILLIWKLVMALLFIQLFTGSILFHTITNIIFTSICICSYILYTLFLQRIKKNDEKGKNIKEEVKTKYNLAVNEWLNMDPCPLLQNNMTLQDIADALNIPRKDFSKYLTDILHTNYSGWLSDLRVRKSEGLIVNTDLNMSEIAYKCGYADLATMSKAFKKKYGIPPREYRKINATISKYKFKDSQYMHLL